MRTGTTQLNIPKEFYSQCTTVSGLRLVHRLRSRGGYTECKTFETSSVSRHFWLVQIGSLPNHMYSYSIQLGIMKARNLSIILRKVEGQELLYQITSLLSLTVWNSTTRTRSLISARLIFLLGTFTRGYCRKWSMNSVIYIITGGLPTVVMESRRRTRLTVIFINVREFFSLLCERRLDSLCLSGNVWHGTQESWHNWDILSGRFVSEFGMLETFPLSNLSVVKVIHLGKASRTSKRLITGWAATILNASRSPGLFRL